MIELEDGLADMYLNECREHLGTIESDLLVMEQAGPDADDELINRVFRAVHSVKGGAGFFALVKIRQLAHQTEEVLALIRARKIVPTAPRVNILLRAVDKLGELIADPGASNQADIAAILDALARAPEEPPATFDPSVSASAPPAKRFKPLRILLAEDDFACRLLLQTFLARYGECHVAVNGREAVEAFRHAFDQGHTYDLICMDIMMPEMDGREAIRRMRALEESWGILSSSGATIIMTTAVDQVKEVFLCFRELCDAYLVKPIELGALVEEMKSYGLVP